MDKLSRRTFLTNTGIAVAVSSAAVASAAESEEVIPGFDDTKTVIDTDKAWQQQYDRKIKVGIAGHGHARFGASFGFQDHPNVEVVAVTDLIPQRCQEMAKACRCDKTYPSLEEMVKDDEIEAIYCATDAPQHAEHCILVMNHGKHVAVAVPAVFGSVEDAHRVFDAVKKTGMTYMMFETSCFHDDLYAMRELYNAGQLGKIMYSEGEYYHYMGGGDRLQTPEGSYKGWRIGLPPQWYPTHANAYYCGVTGGSFTEVTCLALPSKLPTFRLSANGYENPFATEVALFRTSDGSMSRMAVSWDTPGANGEMGRVRGEKGAIYGGRFTGLEMVKMPLKPQLPPTLSAGSHGGSHGYLTDEFIMAIIENRKPLVDVTMALNQSVSGAVAHQSAMQDGETLKIPQFV